MRRHRTTARGILFPLLAGLLAGVFLVPSGGAETAGGSGVPRLIFPLVAKTDLWDNYGDSRGTHSHAGIDMENPWRAPVVAAEAGRVSYAESRLGGCMLYLYGRSGTTFMYIHLNNDLTPRNDNRGGCVKDVTFAVPNGAKVSAGEQVAWNGDSGDASGNPHLHFEVHPNGRGDVNPFSHLSRAAKPLFAAKTGSPFSLGLRGRLVRAGAGTIELEVERVRHYPGGRWLEIDRRLVELTLPPEAVIAPTVARRLTLDVQRLVASSEPLVVYTTKAQTTMETILGGAGALGVSRVVPGG
jgi:Peptidase family M23